MKIYENFDLSTVCTFKIGGIANYLINVSSFDDLKFAVSFAKEKSLPIFILGGGSNLLFPDEGLKAVVIRMCNNDVEVKYDEFESDLFIEFGSGCKWVEVAKFCEKNNYYGLESFFGIPGTIGGAVYGNAGAHGLEMKDVVTEVSCFDPVKFELVKMQNSELDFCYRSSILKSLNLIVLTVTVKVSSDSKDKSGDPVKFAKFRKDNQPTGLTTGSFFRNPSGHYAGQLIEEVGLKNFKLEGIATSEKHANFFINLGDATAKNVISLKEHIVRTVEDKKGIKLEPEVCIVDSQMLINLK